MMGRNVPQLFPPQFYRKFCIRFQISGSHLTHTSVLDDLLGSHQTIATDLQRLKLGLSHSCTNGVIIKWNFSLRWFSQCTKRRSTIRIKKKTASGTLSPSLNGSTLHHCGSPRNPRIEPFKIFRCRVRQLQRGHHISICFLEVWLKLSCLPAMSCISILITSGWNDIPLSRTVTFLLIYPLETQLVLRRGLDLQSHTSVKPNFRMKMMIRCV